MHGLTGGSWKRSTRPTTAMEKNYPTGNPRVTRLRRLQSAAATAPALDPPLGWSADEDEGLNRVDQGCRAGRAAADLAEDPPVLQLGVGPLTRAALTGM